ncbi:platelet glycoprotein VI-like [Chelonoidis abingdonii]|uniref:platelet glycoprotein VI-like n=1 Tax=Chelonoidis abingdonii TaxID=106734 RepID=UPI003F4949E2
MRFALYNNGRLVKTQDPSGNEAVFPITSVGLDDRGMYTCWYRTKSELTEWSKHSDPVELVVAEPSLPKPSASVNPSQGVSVREPVAVSHPSDLALLAVRDYTQGNVVRLALSAGVLLALALILAEAAHGWRRGRP